MSDRPPGDRPNNAPAIVSLVLGSACLLWAFFFGLTPASHTLLGLEVLALVTLPSLITIIFGFAGIWTANRLDGRHKELAILGVLFGFTWWFGCLAAWAITSSGDAALRM